MSSNKILDRARALQKQASALPAGKVIDAGKTWHSYHKVGTGLSLAGLGLGGYTIADANRTAKIDSQRAAAAAATAEEAMKIQQKSLAALNRIHKALAIKVPEDVPVVKGPVGPSGV